MIKKYVSLLVTLAVIIFSIIALFLSGFFTSRKPSSKQVDSEIQTIASEPQESIEVPPLGFPSGEGNVIFDSGVSYSGQWNDYMMEGIGELQYPGIGSYNGSFSESKKNGEGAFTWENGDSYQGFFEQDAIEGNGTYTFANGRVLSGVFHDGTFVEGTDTYSDDNINIIVYFKNSTIDSAEIIWRDGTSYSGEANEAGFNGEGVLSFPNGDIYQGNFRNGLRNGVGKYSWENGDEYSGEWLDDKMNGIGKYVFSSGEYISGSFLQNTFVHGDYVVNNESGEYKIQVAEDGKTTLQFTLIDGTKYSGDYQEGHATGTATIEYASGDTYSGDVIDALKSGSGTYKWSDGSKYTGSWENDQMNGEGTYYYSDSPRKLVGTFNNNLPVGECQYYTTTILYYGTTWENGECIKVTEYAQ